MGTRVKKKILRPFQRFFRMEASSGILLIVATAAALFLSNSAWSHEYLEFWELPLTLTFGEWSISNTLHHWINDGLMVLFFFVVGLEIKREILVGELSSVKQAILPVFSALGGMLAPAVFYLLWNPPGTEASVGWAIPTATDIAFALGLLVLLGSRVPLGLKVFLTALAIVDDLFAILIIALFYTASISWESLGVAAGIFVTLLTINRLGVTHSLPYLLLGVGLWLAFLFSGVHATIAGVLLAIAIPSYAELSPDVAIHHGRNLIQALEGVTVEERTNLLANKSLQAKMDQLGHMVENVQTPLHRMEHALQPVAIFIVMPIFALANAGLVLSADSFWAAFQSSVSLGILMGLVFGKQIGISLFTWMIVKSGLAKLPSGVTWMQIYGVSCLGGIGFTMSLFIGNLSFGLSPTFDQAKVGIFVASLASGIMGWLILNQVLKMPKGEAKEITPPPPSPAST